MKVADVPQLPLHPVFHPARAEHDAVTLGEGLDHLLRRLGTLSGPATGTPPDRVGARVAEVDLDRPLDDAVWSHDPSYAAHLNCPVVVPALEAVR